MGLFWLLVPLSIVASVVIVRHMSPFRAALAGALVTFGILVGIVFPAIVYFTLTGNFDRDPNCDGLCFDRKGGFLFATFIMLYVAIPTSLASGVISLIASALTRRPVSSV